MKISNRSASPGWLAALVPLALVSAACVDHSPVGIPGGDASLSDHAQANLRDLPRMPFRGRGVFAPEAGAGLIDCFSPDGAVVGQFPDAFGATQEFTLLGPMRGDIEVATCSVDQASGRTILAGSVVHTAGDGTRLLADYELEVGPLGRFTLASRITGGTGPLVGAGGSVRGRGVLDPATGVGRYSLAGLLTLPSR